jgi:hypothetical protein
MLGKHWSSKSILLDSVLRRTIQRSKHNVSNGPVGFGLYCEHCLHLRRMPDPCRMGPIGMSALGCGFNGSLQHRPQISLLVSDIARSFWGARLAGVRQR